MNILVVNDDGYQSEGIKILADAMKPYGTVYVVAPHTEQSAKSVAITIHESLVVHQHDERRYSVEGTPSDCVLVALNKLKLPIDLVVSGVNNGFNIGLDTIYSGTIGATMQGLMSGLPGIAFSTDFGAFKIAKREIKETLKWIFDHELYSRKYVLNVNFQAERFKRSKGIKVTYVDIYSHGSMYESIPHGMTDREAVNEGYISVTPLKLGNGDPQLNQELINKIPL